MKQFGKLNFAPVEAHEGLVPVVTAERIDTSKLTGIYVTEIDPADSDTSVLSEKFAIDLQAIANCIVLEAKRGETSRFVACVVLANTRADINGVIRKQLGARKVSFVPMDVATSATGMEYGGITPVGLPEEWGIIIDSKVIATKEVLIGSGYRKSKLLVSGEALGALPNVTVLDCTV